MATIKKAINGILLLNKPLGITSNRALQIVKRIFRAKKAGHTGSLDPLATGMLPICFGEATKFSQYLLDADKCYSVTGRLGIKTTTADSEGEILSQCHDFSVSRTQLEAALSQFVGKILQTPSMFSALKHNGTPLYKLARQGVDIERKAREISIYDLTLNSFDGIDFDLSVRCSKGTYIRNLVEDIGEHLQVGAHVIRLHREYTAGFENVPMHELKALENSSLDELNKTFLPADRAVLKFPQYIVSADSVQDLAHGKKISPHANAEVHDKILRLYDEQENFIGLGKFDTDGMIKSLRLVSTSKYLLEN